MGGEIWLDENYDSGVDGCPGARFVIDLRCPPISADVVEAVACIESPEMAINDEKTPKASPRNDLPAGLTVLIVDDDMVLRKMLKRTMRKVTTDWQVFEAANGETALRLAEDQQFDLIFLDQYMTSTDRQLLGTETARELRAKGVQSTICGLSANDMALQFIESGANAFMMKPFPCGEEDLVTELIRVIASGTTSE